MPKPKKRKPDLRRIRPTKTYSLPEIAGALNRNIATVQSWLRQGLPTLDNQKPTMVAGSDLKSWLKHKWAVRKQKCLPGELYCFKCRKPRTPLSGSVLITVRNEKTLTIKARCGVCGTRMNQTGSSARIREIKKIFGPLLPHKEHLIGCINASTKHTPEQLTFGEACAEGGEGQITTSFASRTGGKAHQP